jgi:hypothetical protein
MATMENFPQRIFLDSSTLQTMLRYGGFLYEREPVAINDPIHRDSEGIKKLEALRRIMEVAERAPFEFAVSVNSFNEVRRAKDSRYLRWAYDVLDHWRVCLEENGSPVIDEALVNVLDSEVVGYLGKGDRDLIRDALGFGCDTFLTMENKLPRNGAHLHRVLHLRVESPTGVWERILPWAALFR